MTNNYAPCTTHRRENINNELKIGDKDDLGDIIWIWQLYCYNAFYGNFIWMSIVDQTKTLDIPPPLPRQRDGSLKIYNLWVMSF